MSSPVAFYGIPWYVDTRVLFYRSDLLKKAGFDTPPRSWEEWQRALAAVKREVGPSRYAILLPLNEFEPLLALGLQQDQPLLRDRQRIRIVRDVPRPSPAVCSGEPPVGAATGNAEISNVWSEFGRGFFSFYISGPWNIEEFKRRLPSEHQGDWMTAPLPGPHGPGASTAGGSSLVIFRSSRHAQATWRLIEFLSEPAVQVRFHQLTGDLPPRRSAWQDEQLAGNVYAKAFFDQLERARPAPQVPEWERIMSEMQLIAEQVVSGRMDTEEATRALDARVGDPEKRWMPHAPSPTFQRCVGFVAPPCS
jgi:multiple sugar transport system substrate-binding protein